jgi:pheromone shutdown protein TraB
VAAPRRALSEALLQRRDQFMAQRIHETLKSGETGILFLGMLHSLERYLNPDVKVIYPLHRSR